MKVKIGVVGFGEFSLSHLDIFLRHPDVDLVVGAELNPEIRSKVSENYGIRMYESFDKMLEDDKEINSVGIFTPRHLHGPMIIKALKAGKNVITAVPMGCTKEEIFEILELVKTTGLTFAMAETCYYFPCAVWARKANKNKKFGDVVFGEAQYYHDITEMLGVYASKRVAGIPPMLYGTHSAAMLISAMNERPTEISCFGYRDKVGDEIYGEGVNDWDNPFSNEVAIIRFESGALGRLNEFRRIGTTRPSSYITGIYGTHGAYEYSGNQHLYCKGKVFGQEPQSFDLSDEINTMNYVENKDRIKDGAGRIDYKYQAGWSKVHNIERLPKCLVEYAEELRANDVNSLIGHNGSHFLTIDDFVQAIVQNKIPPINAWRSAEYTLTGIIAHESAMLGGKTLEIPDVGNPPEDMEVLDFD